MPSPAYTLRYKKSVAKELRQLPGHILPHVVRKIQALAENPHPAGSVKLSGEADLYRVRYADYRVIYQVNGRELIILVVKIGHRREVYRSL